LSGIFQFRVLHGEAALRNKLASDKADFRNISNSSCKRCKRLL
jgi:hypothetical protein